MAETLTFLPEGTIIPSRQVEAALPVVRHDLPERILSNSEQLMANLSAGLLPTELDNAISTVMVRHMSKN